MRATRFGIAAAVLLTGASALVGCGGTRSYDGGAISITWVGGTAAQHDQATRSCGLPAPYFRVDTPTPRRDPSDQLTSWFALPDHGQKSVTAASVRTCLAGNPLVAKRFGGVVTLA